MSKLSSLSVYNVFINVLEPKRWEIFCWSMVTWLIFVCCLWIRYTL